MSVQRQHGLFLRQEEPVWGFLCMYGFPLELFL